jgi:branched-chain amino acid transport system ATP-binding protein
MAASTHSYSEPAVADALLQTEGLTKRFGGVVASDAISLGVLPGELHAIIGPNGAGKTTLIGQLTGEIAADGGRIRFAGRDITALPVYRRSRLGLARSFQIASLFADLSHGERRQLEIAMALATGPRLLLLDEPMAGMGPEESARLVATLRQLKGAVTVLLIEHDMDAVFALADRISVLVYGRVIASGDSAAIKADAAVRDAYLGEQDILQQEAADG